VTDPAEEPRDPFLDEEGRTAWHHSLRKGEMVFLGLTELPTIYDVVRALKGMPESDLKCIVLERLYVWHARKDGPPVLPPDEWLSPPVDPNPRGDDRTVRAASPAFRRTRWSLPGHTITTPGQCRNPRRTSAKTTGCGAPR
jgi:hypothetical protein